MARGGRGGAWLLGLSLASAGLRGECLSPVRSEKTAYLNAAGLVAGRANSVYDLALSSAGRLCVPDFRHDRLLWFDRDLRQTGVTRAIPSPHGAAFAPDGSLFVATYRAGRVLKFSPEGKEVRGWDKRLAEQGRIVHPVSIAVDAAGRVYIADLRLGRIVKAGPEGDWELDMAPPGSEGFSPHGIGTDGDSRVYAADRALRSVRVFSLAGKPEGSWPAPSKDFDPLSVRPMGRDLLLVPSYGEGRVHLFDSSGRPLSSFGGEGLEDGRFQGPTNAAADVDGRVFVVEEGSNRVQRIDLRGLIGRPRGR